MNIDKMREHAKTLFPGIEIETSEQDIAVADIMQRWLMTAEYCERLEGIESSIRKLTATLKGTK